MTTYEMCRCKKCSFCVVADDGTWVCKENGEDIHEIKDEDCPVEQDY